MFFCHQSKKLCRDCFQKFFKFDHHQQTKSSFHQIFYTRKSQNQKEKFLKNEICYLSLILRECYLKKAVYIYFRRKGRIIII
ncbi:unnamed protein product [Paramecium sonneborni]|uniref:Uncharacterized protein n=1 Tax=Paramecium sonneborni TaxID=65129 RepID=A0A8S1JWN6_9CILI|nr:unnamed protein product [Paramecium sonneborni]